jgi:hypothetical protein
LSLNVCQGTDLTSKLQAFHSSLNKLRKEKGAMVVMIANANEKPAVRRYLSECYAFVLCMFLVKRRGLDPRQAAALLMKRSGKMCELSEESVVYAEKWKELSYPDAKTLPLPRNLLLAVEGDRAASPTPMGETESGGGLGNSSGGRSSPVSVPEKGVKKSAVPVRVSGHVSLVEDDPDNGTEAAEESSTVPLKFLPLSANASQKHANRVSMNEFVGSAPSAGAAAELCGSSGGASDGARDNGVGGGDNVATSSEGSLSGSSELKREEVHTVEKRNIVESENGRAALRQSAPGRSSSRELESALPQESVLVPVLAKPKSMETIDRRPSSSPALPSVAPEKSEVEKTSPRNNLLGKGCSMGNLEKEAAPQGDNLSSSQGAMGKTLKTKVARNTSTGNFLSRLGAKLVGKKGPKTDLPDSGHSSNSNNNMNNEEDSPRAATRKSPDDHEKEKRKEKVADEQDKRMESSSSSKREIVDMVVFSDLPSEDQRLVSEAALDSEDCEQNLFVLLNVLHFHTKKVYRLRDLKTGELRITSSDREDDTFDYAKAEIELLTSKEDPQKLFKLAGEVGRGGFGSVFECIQLKNKKQLVACKILPHNKSKDKKYNLQEVPQIVLFCFFFSSCFFFFCRLCF